MVLDRQVLSVAVRPPRMSALEAPLVWKEPPPPRGADELAQSPLPLGFGGVPCHDVSHPLRDPTEGVDDSASWLWNE